MEFQCKLRQMWTISIIICACDCPIVFVVTMKIRDKPGRPSATGMFDKQTATHTGVTATLLQTIKSE